MITDEKRKSDDDDDNDNDTQIQIQIETQINHRWEAKDWRAPLRDASQVCGWAAEARETGPHDDKNDDDINDDDNDNVKYVFRHDNHLISKLFSPL